MCKIKYFLLAVFLWNCTYFLSAQENAQDTLYMDFIRVPIPSVDSTVLAVHLLAHPLRSPETPGDKYRLGDWVRLDYSKYPGILVPTKPKSGRYKRKKIESHYVYLADPEKQQKYKFYYKGEAGERIRDVEYRSIKFSKLTDVRELFQSYKCTVPQRGKDVHEVYRWQHPNLYVVMYDKSRQGYYRYRIALVIYTDPYHPDAYVINQ